MIKAIILGLVFAISASAQTYKAPLVRATQDGEYTINSGTNIISISIDRITTGDEGAPGSSKYVPIEIYDAQEGKEVQVTPIKELRVVSGHRLVGSTFINGFFDYNFWSSGTITNGTISVSSGSLHLFASSGTQTNGASYVQSIRTARFVSGSANEFRGVVRISTSIPSVGTNDMRWGLSDANSATALPSNGFYFRYSNGAFYVGYRLAGVETNISTSQFNGSIPTITSNYTRYQIIYTNLGASFYVNDYLVHKISPTDASLTETVNFKARAQNINSNGANDQNVLEAKVLTILRLGSESTTPIKKYIGTAGSYLLKFGPGFFHHISVNDPGITGSSVSVYDSTSAVSANTIAVLNTAKTSIGSVMYDCPFDNGLFIVTSGTFGNITIVYE